MSKRPVLTPSAHCQPLPAAAKPWFVYLVRAANGALYCGISDDPQRRFAQHQNGKGARFFHSSPAQALVYIEACVDKGAALREERGIKGLKKSAKEALVANYALIEAADAVPSA
jgi:putative endonuclease